MSKLRMVFTGSLFVMLILSVICGRDQRTDPVSVEADYGFPLIWGTQRCVTENYSRSRVFALLITERPTAEPVNETAAGVELEELARYLVVGAVQELWRVNRFYLLLDLVFWIGLMTITAIFATKMPKLRIPRIRIAIEFQDGAERETCPKDRHE